MYSRIFGFLYSMFCGLLLDLISAVIFFSVIGWMACVMAKELFSARLRRSAVSCDS